MQTRRRSLRYLGRNPLKTGLVPASLVIILTDNGLRPLSQSPENGSRPCKGDDSQNIPRRLDCLRRNPLKAGLVPARRIGTTLSRHATLCARRNPLKTGLVPASGLKGEVNDESQSKSSQSPENGSRPCKGGGGFFFSSPLYRPLTPSFPPASIRLRVL